jgi:hypothetical protein
MRLHHISFSVLVHAAFMVACIPAPSPPVVQVDASITDASIGSVCSTACANLKRIGCPEGDTPDGGKSCVSICEAAEASGKFNLQPACVSVAKTKDDVRACKSVRCSL